jgi:hypothetical protein
MANQNLLTVFVAVVALAVVIQAGILAGFYFVSLKLKQQADRAFFETNKLFGPTE